MIYSANINRGSNLDAIAGLMAGTWDEYNSREWHIVKTPMFLCITGTFSDGGTYPLPFRFGMTVMADIAYGDGTSAQKIVKLSGKWCRISDFHISCSSKMKLISSFERSIFHIQKPEPHHMKSGT